MARIIQELLGHQSVDTTTIYAHLSIEKLREAHAATRPGTKVPSTEPPTAPTEGTDAPKQAK